MASTEHSVVLPVARKKGGYEGENGKVPVLVYTSWCRARDEFLALVGNFRVNSHLNGDKITLELQKAHISTHFSNTGIPRGMRIFIRSSLEHCQVFMLLGIFFPGVLMIL